MQKKVYWISYKEMLAALWIGCGEGGVREERVL